jgi:hypothetical protein
VVVDFDGMTGFEIALKTVEGQGGKLWTRPFEFAYSERNFPFPSRCPV